MFVFMWIYVYLLMKMYTQRYCISCQFGKKVTRGKAQKNILQNIKVGYSWGRRAWIVLKYFFAIFCIFSIFFYTKHVDFGN